jgi:hypothetical protein
MMTMLISDLGPNFVMNKPTVFTFQLINIETEHVLLDLDAEKDVGL